MSDATNNAAHKKSYTQEELTELEGQLSELKGNKDAEGRALKMRNLRRNIRSAKKALGIAYGRGSGDDEGDDNTEDEGSDTADEPEKRKPARDKGTRQPSKNRVARTQPSRATYSAYQNPPLESVQALLSGLEALGLEQLAEGKSLRTKSGYGFVAQRCVEKGATAQLLVAKFRDRVTTFNPTFEPKHFWLQDGLLLLGPIPDASM
jgi:hypothetical protein